MGLFSFRRKESKPEIIIQRMIDYMPEHYRTLERFRDSEEYLRHREWGLALESLIELATETGHYFSEEFWSGLADGADEMGLKEQAEFCREQINRNEREVNSKTPFGWTTIKISETLFQHHISDKIKNKWKSERREKDNVMSLLEKDGVHLKSHGRGGLIYIVDKGRIAEIDFELGVEGLILYFDKVDHWTIPLTIQMTGEERAKIEQQLKVWSAETKNAIAFY